MSTEDGSCWTPPLDQCYLPASQPPGHAKPAGQVDDELTVADAQPSRPSADDIERERAGAGCRGSGNLCLVDGIELAELLAERLHEVVPADYAVVADRGLVMIRRRDGSSAGGVAGLRDIVDQPGDALMHVMSACHCAIDLVQDLVVEDTANMWPGTVPTSPRVAVAGRRLRLWYGREGEAGPVLELRPIVLG
jgi:hypothetical protein